MLNSIRKSARAVSKWKYSTPIRKSWSSPNAKTAFVRSGYPPLWSERSRRLFGSTSDLSQHATVPIDPVQEDDNVSPPHLASQASKERLPVVCPGCGAHSQTVDPESAGFYGSRRAAKANHKSAARREEDEVFQRALQSGTLSGWEGSSESLSQLEEKSHDVPICDRCHYLLYQSKGTGIIHPSMQSIRDIIEESPYKHNHIYHVLDAADFPMSLIPSLQEALKLPRLRTQNRRAKTIRYLRGRVAEVSFIITRSDLLAPKKEQVDSLVPYLREVLRDALGRSGRNVRLGNVRCVSANRGWWTKTVKEDIWNRGGAGWMVGKANVGKSALYEVVFPKGRNQVDTDVRRIRHEEKQALQKDVLLLGNSSDKASSTANATGDTAAFAYSPMELSEKPGITSATQSGIDAFQEAELELAEPESEQIHEDTFFDEDEGGSLLPPAQPETVFPRMPIVSALPGTTASPIRIPFGNGKGELIDLPGIHRSSFDTHIKPEHQKELVMKSRVVPEQYTIKPGQSMLLGGTIRITPKTEDMVFLAYPFVPLKAHVTSTEKAIAIQTGSHEDGESYTGTVESIAADSAKQAMQSAGTFRIEWDVTKRRAGPLTAKAAGKQKAADLPFIVYSADLLIESVGWVELVCQVRSRRKSFISETVVDALGKDTMRVQSVPEVEVWSPEGKFVGLRRPMNGWLLGGPKKTPKYAQRARPRQTISMARRKAGGAAGQNKKEMVLNE